MSGSGHYTQTLIHLSTLSTSHASFSSPVKLDGSTVLYTYIHLLIEYDLTCMTTSQVRDVKFYIIIYRECCYSSVYQ